MSDLENGRSLDIRPMNNGLRTLTVIAARSSSFNAVLARALPLCLPCMRWKPRSEDLRTRL
jgi:hypothetical protein